MDVLKDKVDKGVKDILEAIEGAETLRDAVSRLVQSSALWGYENAKDERAEDDPERQCRDLESTGGRRDGVLRSPVPECNKKHPLGLAAHERTRATGPNLPQDN